MTRKEIYDKPSEFLHETLYYIFKAKQINRKEVLVKVHWADIEELEKRGYKLEDVPIDPGCMVDENVCFCDMCLDKSSYQTKDTPEEKIIFRGPMKIVTW